MEYLKFILLFVFLHTLSYTLAGALALRISGDIYRDRSRLCTFLRDMNDPEESAHVQKYFFLAQIPRALLMALVLLPLLEAIRAMSFGSRFFFFSGLMFVYTHLAAASPFPDNIEGQVYFRPEYLKRSSFLRFQLEMLIYCALFGGMIGMAL